MWSVVQEIHYLAQLTGFCCPDFKHIIVGAKVLDPIEMEGHLFTEEGSAAHKAFDASRPSSVYRNLDCGPDAEGICYIVPGEHKKTFEDMAAGLGLQMKWGGAPIAPKTLLTYSVPDNFTWIVTHMYLRSLPEPNDADLGAGDWRSDDFEATGLTKAWLEVKEQAVTSKDSSTFNLFDKPVLFAFQGGDIVEVVVRRDPASLPVEQQIHLALHGYLAPAPAYDKLTGNVTQIEAFFS